MTTTVTEHHLGRLAERAFEGHDPDAATILFEGTWHTRRELFERVTRLAGGLASLTEPGDRVVVLMANSPDVGVLYQACWRAGLVATPVIFLLPPPELRHVLVDADARVLVTSPEFLAGVQVAVDGLDVTVVCPGGPEGTLDLEDLAGADPLGVVDRADTDLAALLYTGGTTGRSKGVMLSHENLWHAGSIGHRTTAHDHLARTIVPLPLSHSFGLLVTVTGLHDPNETVAVLQRWFDPAGFVDLVEAHRVEQAAVVPTMLRLLLTLDLAGRDLSSLQRLVCGSAPLPREVLEAFERAVPSATICEGYGLTETAAATTVNRREARRLGTVGQALLDIDLRVVDDEGEEVPTGEPGEVLVRSPTNALGYWGSPEDTAATFTADGWVRTGDIGALDADGYLTILDRKKDLIIRNGFNVYPRDVEDVLHAHPGVGAAGVVGRPDDAVGEEVVAFVAPAPGATLDPEEVRAWAKEHVGAKSYPRDVRVVEAIPLTPVMKTDRKALRDLL
ncbi:MAG: class I adenylate-forming enzyme family protein [Actinomycetes bacterium]